ncbi:hypothetical protein GCM10009731_25960 [Streptomyces globosus]
MRLSDEEGSGQLADTPPESGRGPRSGGCPAAARRYDGAGRAVRTRAPARPAAAACVGRAAYDVRGTRPAHPRGPPRPRSPSYGGIRARLGLLVRGGGGRMEASRVRPGHGTGGPALPLSAADGKERSA